MLKIFNTLTKKKEIFFSLCSKKKINIYVCGVTVYDLCHIGHARTFIIFDIIIRYLKHLGCNIYYVRNITDIDDKIINKAIIKNQSVTQFVQEMIQCMNKDFFDLNLIPPNKEPRVTEFIPEIIDFITTLLKKKYAYLSSNQDVLFSVNSCQQYGLLSNRLKNFTAYKDVLLKQPDKNVLHDFALWKNKSYINNNDINNKKKYYSESLWSSPWGIGRPGWHTECSAIINTIFQSQVDIHGGGVDLLFPHHENEMIQLDCMNPSFFVKFWMHTGMVISGNDNQKMSKSLFNSVYIRDLLKKYHSEVIRYYLCLTHYRHPAYFSEKILYTSYHILNKIYFSLLDCSVNLNISVDYELPLRNLFKDQFYNAMNDDFNTPQACLVLQKISRYINKIKKNNVYLANLLASDLVSLGNILGLLNENPKIFLFSNKKISAYNINVIEQLVCMRNNYRLKKQWHLADILRKKLLELRVRVQDNKDNSTTYQLI